MPPKVTRLDIAGALNGLNRLAGTDYLYTYHEGGFRIEAMDGSCPFGHKRRVAKQMLDCLNFAIDALKIADKQKGQ